jgi:hypothetical protein
MGARRRTLLRGSALMHDRGHAGRSLACFGHELRAPNIAGMAAASRMERWFGPIRTTLPYFSCSCCMIRCWCPARDTYDHRIRDVRAKGGLGNLARGWNGEIRYRIVEVTRARMYTAKDGKNERRAPNLRMRGGPRTSASMLLIESGSLRLTTAWASCRVHQTVQVIGVSAGVDTHYSCQPGGDERMSCYSSHANRWGERQRDRGPRKHVRCTSSALSCFVVQYSSTRAANETIACEM